MGVRLALLALLVLTPGAAAWSVEVRAPAEASEAEPFPIEVCADGEVRVLAENATLDVREDRYQPAGCRTIHARPDAGVVRLEARVRAAAGSAIRARAYANVTIASAAGELRIVDAWAAPFAGVAIVNVGNQTARLGLRALDGEPLPDARLAPGETIFVGPRAPPGFERHAPMELRARNATLALTLGSRVESSLVVPKLAAGASIGGPYGRTNASWSGELDEVLVYALPGATPIPALVDAAREEVLVESHTLTSPDIAAALARASDRGCRVRVLLEGASPGGIPPDERAIVATLQARGAEVLLLGGEGARYRTMHAKLVVVDRASVAIGTENYGEGSARGFGLVVHDASLARAIADAMTHDMGAWHDVARAAFADPPAELAPSVREASASAIGSANATLVLSPDDPRPLAAAIAGARASVDVAMLRAEAEGPMIDALVAAARAGADVRLLLDGRFDEGTNRETAARLNALAARENVSLVAKLDEPARTLHAKAFVVDGRASYVGSMNWVRAAWEDNREAGLLVESGALAAWLTLEFEKDWQEEEEEARAEVPAPLWIALAGAAISLRLRRAPSRLAGGPGRGSTRRRSREACRSGSAPSSCNRA